MTTKPPNIFTAASATAIRPKILDKDESIGPAASKAPTIMTEDIAFVTPIRGLCNAGVTDQTT